MDACTTLLSLRSGNKWLDHLVTGDEKWVYYSNNHRKAQWVDAGEQADDIPKRELHMKKIMLSVWWSVAGSIYKELLPERTTVIVNVYSK